VNERCFVRVRWDPVPAAGAVRSAVGGFLRYIQHRDLHPDSQAGGASPVAGLVKYVAYRDRANTRAELFGREGRISTSQRKAFADYVARSIIESKPQLFRQRDGRLQDRRRSVSRFVISPERAAGLDLEALTRAGVSRLESELGVSGLRWIAAIHRNTAHHHIHLVLAGLHQSGDSAYRRVEVTKPRLAAMKEAVGLEIERQRLEREPRHHVTPASVVMGGASPSYPALKRPVFAPTFIRIPPMASPASLGARRRPIGPAHRPAGESVTVLRLRAAARRYQRQMQQDTDMEARRLGWGRA
jgi:hypothetical protein